MLKPEIQIFHSNLTYLKNGEYSLIFWGESMFELLTEERMFIVCKFIVWKFMRHKRLNSIPRLGCHTSSNHLCADSHRICIQCDDGSSDACLTHESSRIWNVIARLLSPFPLTLFGFAHCTLYGFYAFMLAFFTLHMMHRSIVSEFLSLFTAWKELWLDFFSIFIRDGKKNVFEYLKRSFQMFCA